jgi:hypothetical protein
MLASGGVPSDGMGFSSFVATVWERTFEEMEDGALGAGVQGMIS